jgi:hypothetical protein
MKLNFKQHTFAFKFIIWLDRGLNVITGGSFQECLSTRAYVMTEKTNSKKWIVIRDAINWMFWEGHCRDSLEWELNIKQQWIIKHRSLVR